MTPPSRELRDLEGILQPHYALEREIGRGGMGVVFLARDLKLDRDVAIKALPLHLADDQRVRERFLREARTAARLSHPNIVPIHRADEVEGRVFFVMGYVDGESLAQRVAAEGAVQPAELIPLLIDVAEALGEAHRHGIVHRDVKAENILIDGRTGRAMVTDFGIARVAESAPLTATGLLLGTVQYMSPEQVVGEPVDARSDLYSLGIVAFFALTGRFPFQNEAASAVLVAHVTKAAPRIQEVAPSIEAPLAAVVDRCLAKEPGDRFESAAHVVAALRAIDRDAPPPVRPRSVAPRQAAPARTPDEALLSDEEARQIWERASRLQAQVTGTLTPPPLGDSYRASTPATASAAYRVDVVRDSAREAGIGTEYVDRALAERGLLGASAPPARAPAKPVRSTPAAPFEIKDIRLKPVSPWAGAPASIEYESVLDGEVAERDFDQFSETIRRVLADPGIVGATTRSFTWSTSDPKRRVHVTAHVRHGRTTIRVTETLRQTMGSVFGGGMGGFGGGVGGTAFGMLLGLTQGAFEIAVPVAFAIVAASYGGSRTVYKRLVASREEELRGLLKLLIEDAQQSIEARSDERGRPALPRR